jgi:hypothetical protein
LQLIPITGIYRVENSTIQNKKPAKRKQSAGRYDAKGFDFYQIES